MLLFTKPITKAEIIRNESIIENNAYGEQGYERRLSNCCNSFHFENDGIYYFFTCITNEISHHENCVSSISWKNHEYLLAVMTVLFPFLISVDGIYWRKHPVSS